MLRLYTRVNEFNDALYGLRCVLNARLEAESIGWRCTRIMLVSPGPCEIHLMMQSSEGEVTSFTLRNTEESDDNKTASEYAELMVESLKRGGAWVSTSPDGIVPIDPPKDSA